MFFILILATRLFMLKSLVMLIVYDSWFKKAHDARSSARLFLGICINWGGVITYLIISCVITTFIK